MTDPRRKGMQHSPIPSVNGSVCTGAARRSHERTPGTLLHALTAFVRQRVAALIESLEPR